MIVFRYLKINRKNLSSENNIRITDISVSVSDYDGVDECFKAINDCDVTYKITTPLHNNVFLNNQSDYFLASNDEKNSTKYQATSMQDIYPTDFA
ncbi:MAG: hypothetical protein IJT36_09870 [Alphaproteobacteria bacterium]|nr:hypothetical protein [Alphaproteobacteria bacterium]